MNKLLIIDGNSIMNRGFYGLPPLTNKDGLHTNAILGFLNIIFKVMDEEKPTHCMVAFDLKAPTFRHLMFKDYKGTRKPMDDSLREQFPVVKDVLRAMNITIVEKEGYEADDILGTISRMGISEGYDVTVLSGDRDLLQLATDKVLVRIPKTKAGGTIIENYYAKDVEELYGVDPIKFIDLKGLMGDSSDNIPGVPGIGEKTAAKIISTYGSIENAILHIDEIKPDKARKNLDEFRDQAILSKVLATIKLDCELDIKISDLEISAEGMFNQNSLDLYTRLEFKSLIKRFEFKGDDIKEFQPEIQIIDDFDEVLSFFGKIKKGVVGVSVLKSEEECFAISYCFEEKVTIIYIANFITIDLLKEKTSELLSKGVTISFIDLKECIFDLGLTSSDKIFDCGLAAYLIDPMVSSYDYSYILNRYLTLNADDEKTVLGKKSELNIFTAQEETYKKVMSYKSYAAANSFGELLQRLEDMGMKKLYYDIELPLVFTLDSMERYGIRADKDALFAYGEKLKSKISYLTEEIYKLAGEEFNINSTKKLGEILFEKLGLTSGKKTKSGYSTNVDVLEKIKNDHEIVPLILEYRQLTKLNSTYVEGLAGYIKQDGRIHGKLNQKVTATGRISSTEPNLQNIPMRHELGREIRKVFIPEEGYTFIDADYSQIELRVLAHISDDKTLIDAYNKSEDIHAITASEVFNVPIDQIDGTLRRRAKAVNFGIVYGISSFGLGQDLDISRKEAQTYIDKYFETYKGVKEFLDDEVSKAKEDGFVKTLYGRIRPIPELKSSNFMQRSFGERIAMNSPIQGTAADIIKIAMINVDNELKNRKLKSRLILQIHDELLVETKEEELDEVKSIIADKMMNAAKLSIPLYIDMHEGRSWFDAK